MGGVAPPSPCPRGGWQSRPEGLCVPWGPPGTRLGQGGPAWPGLAMGTNLWIPGQSPRAQRTMSSPPRPGRGAECLGSQASCCQRPGVSPPLSPGPCPSRSRFLWSVPSPVSWPVPLQVPLPSQCSVHLSRVQTLSLRLIFWL